MMEDELDMNVTSFQHQEDIFESELEEERKRIADESSDENDSLLVRYDINSDVSLWEGHDNKNTVNIWMALRNNGYLNKKWNSWHTQQFIKFSI